MDDGEREEAVTRSVENIKVLGDEYRSILSEEAGNTEWRHGGPPIFDKVNKLFNEWRTKIEWPRRSIEEAVQIAMKSWALELSHKTRLQDFKTINPEKFKLIVNDTVCID
ncbi:hypothetical protein SLE2022_116620 [Rubroshorea leprosula]